MVCVWRYHHHGCCCFVVAYGASGSLYYRYNTDDSTRYFHVEYALCMRILYKTKFPFNLVFNKMEQHDFALEWISDFEEFQVALVSHSGKYQERTDIYEQSNERLWVRQE